MSHSFALRPLRLLAVALVALATFLALGSVASAQTDCYGGTVPPPGGGVDNGGEPGRPWVCGSSTTVPQTTPSSEVPPPGDNPDTPPPTVLGTSQTSGFALTGGDVLGLVAIGGGALAVGAALVLATRRRRALEVV